MKALTSLFQSTGILFSGGVLQGNSPQSGFIALYGIQYKGVATARGEPCRMDQMTAAHESLPFGSIVRVAHFETEKMVDVRDELSKASRFSLTQPFPCCRSSSGHCS
jgi:hypothetical protein